MKIKHFILTAIIALVTSAAWGANNLSLGPASIELSGVSVVGGNITYTAPYATLSWTAVAGADQYLITFERTDVANNLKSFYVSGGATSYTFDTTDFCQSSGWSYNITLRAIQNSPYAESADSESVITFSCADAPAVITDSGAVTTSSTSVATTTILISTTSSSTPAPCTLGDTTVYSSTVSWTGNMIACFPYSASCEYDTGYAQIRSSTASRDTRISLYTDNIPLGEPGSNDSRLGSVVITSDGTDWTKSTDELTVSTAITSGQQYWLCMHPKDTQTLAYNNVNGTRTIYYQNYDYTTAGGTTGDTLNFGTWIRNTSLRDISCFVAEE